MELFSSLCLVCQLRGLESIDKYICNFCESELSTSSNSIIIKYIDRLKIEHYEHDYEKDWFKHRTVIDGDERFSSPLWMDILGQFVLLFWYLFTAFKWIFFVSISFIPTLAVIRDLLKNEQYSISYYFQLMFIIISIPLIIKIWHEYICLVLNKRPCKPMFKKLTDSLLNTSRMIYNFPGRETFCRMGSHILYALFILKSYRKYLKIRSKLKLNNS